METIITSAAEPAFDLDKVRKRDLIRARYKGWAEPRNGLLVDVRPGELTAVFVPGAGAATAYYTVKASEVAAGDWTLLVSADLSGVRGVEPAPDDPDDPKPKPPGGNDDDDDDDKKGGEPSAPPTPGGDGGGDTSTGSESDMTNSEFEARLKTLEVNRETLATANAALQASCDALTARCALLDSTAKTADGRLATLETSAGAAQTALAEMGGRCSALESRSETLAADYGRLNQACVDLSGTAAGLGKGLARTQADAEALRGGVDGLEKRCLVLTEYGEAIAGMRGQVAALNAAMTGHVADCGTAHAALNDRCGVLEGRQEKTSEALTILSQTMHDALTTLGSGVEHMAA